jgi:hypothetical protein
LQCDICNGWNHTKYENLKKSPNENEPYTCRKCNVDNLKEQMEKIMMENAKLKAEVKKKDDNRDEVLEGTSRNSSSGEEIKELIKVQKQILCRQLLQDLPEYSGDPEGWPLFYSQFAQSTLEGNISDSLNIIRLKKALKGPALEAVKAILMLPDNLKMVINILKQRFGNPRVLIRRKLSQLNDLPLAIENKPHTMTKLFEFLLDLQVTLMSLKSDSYLESPQLVDSVLEKLSPVIGENGLKNAPAMMGRLLWKNSLTGSKVFMILLSWTKISSVRFLNGKHT